MKIQLFLLTFILSVASGYAQENNGSKAVTSVYHNLNNITLVNFDGTRSTIMKNGNSATLINADGSHSTINCFGDSSSNIVAIDDTHSSVRHNGNSSTVMNADGTQFIVHHKRTSSSCSKEGDIHVITHFFGNKKERHLIDQIDVLIHQNWLTKMKMEKALVQLGK